MVIAERKGITKTKFKKPCENIKFNGGKDGLSKKFLKLYYEIIIPNKRQTGRGKDNSRSQRQKKDKDPT